MRRSAPPGWWQSVGWIPSTKHPAPAAAAPAHPPARGQVELQPRLLAQLQRQPDGERAAAAQLALQRHLAAEQLRQLADDRQAQAGAGVLAGQRVAGLAELLEDQLLLLRARCRRRCRSRSATRCCASASALSSTRPPSGVNLIALDSRFVQDLLQLAGVLPQRAGWPASSWPRRSMFFFSASGRNMVSRPSQTSCDAELLEADLHLAGLDLGQVEDVVDQGQQLLAAGLDVAAPSAAACRSGCRRTAAPR